MHFTSQHEKTLSEQSLLLPLSGHVVAYEGTLKVFMFEYSTM